MGTVDRAYFLLRILENILVNERGGGIAGAGSCLPRHVAGILKRVKKEDEVERENVYLFSLRR